MHIEGKRSRDSNNSDFLNDFPRVILFSISSEMEMEVSSLKHRLITYRLGEQAKSDYLG